MYPRDESKRVGRSLIVLLAALLLVYVIFFDVHGDKLRIGSLTGLDEIEQTRSGNELTGADIDRMVYIDTTNQVSNNQNSDDVYYPSYYQDSPNVAQTQPDTGLIQAQNIQKDALVVDPTPQAGDTSTVPDIINDTQGRRFYSTDFLFGRSDPDDLSSVNVGSTANPVGVNAGVSNTNVAQQAQNIVAPAVAPTTTPTNPISTLPTGSIQFANTRVWDGMLTILQSLELDDDVRYILKDINNTHYIYMGQLQGSVASLVTFLGGTTVDINDQTTIKNNQLFGANVQRITMPSYKSNLKELMLVRFANGDVRFLQIDKDWYNQLQNKLEIKQKFETYY